MRSEDNNGELSREGVRPHMRAVIEIFRFVFLLVSAAVRTWWVFRGETGVEADDPEKERGT